MAYPYVTDLLNAVLGTDWDLPLPTFGAFVALAILIGTHLFRREVVRLGTVGAVPREAAAVVGDVVVISTLTGILGARVFHVLDNPDLLALDPLSMILSTGGFSIYGGLGFGLAAGITYLRRRSIPVLPMLDAAAPALLLGYAIGRIGCQVSGDGDWGLPADLALKPEWLPIWFWAQTYGGNILGLSIAAPGVYPTPVYETTACLLLCVALLALRSPLHRPGYLFSAYLLFAGFERLLIEKIRVNVDHPILGVLLTQAEAISILLVVAGAIGLLVRLRIRRVWIKATFAVGTLAALSACVPF